MVTHTVYTNKQCLHADVTPNGAHHIFIFNWYSVGTILLAYKHCLCRQSVTLAFFYFTQPIIVISLISNRDRTFRCSCNDCQREKRVVYNEKEMLRPPDSWHGGHGHGSWKTWAFGQTTFPGISESVWARHKWLYARVSCLYYYMLYESSQRSNASTETIFITLYWMSFFGKVYLIFSEKGIDKLSIKESEVTASCAEAKLGDAPSRRGEKRDGHQRPRFSTAATPHMI